MLKTLKPTQPAGTIPLSTADLITELENALGHSTQGIWQKGQTSHDTVTETKYKIGSFHHADDASFADVMHAQAPAIIEHLKSLLEMQKIFGAKLTLDELVAFQATPANNQIPS